MIRFKCPYCEKVLEIADTDAGRKGKCPGCGKRIGIPQRVALNDNEIDKIVDMVADAPTPKPPPKISPWAKEHAKAFSEATKDQAYRRSGGHCECWQETCPKGHKGRCPAGLTRHGAHYHHVTAEAVGGSNGLSNCQVLCPACDGGLPISDESSFADAIKNKIASKHHREDEITVAAEATKKRHQDACGMAMRVRDEVIIPLLRQLKIDCESQGVICWSDVRSDSNSGTVESLSTHSARRFVIKGEVGNDANDELLVLSVTCDYANPLNASTSKPRPLHPLENKKQVPVTDDLNGIRSWYLSVLKVCLENCIDLIPVP
jgi:hypothetical protein